jgi:beta-N-acetylhexosaminidase
MATPRRARAGVAALALALVASGCTGGDEPGPRDDPEGPGAATATEDPPTPAERLGLSTGWGPTRAELERAARLVRTLPLPDLAGQVIVASWSGTAAPVGLVRRLHLGGVIVFTDNVVSTDQVRAMTARLRRDVRRPWPLQVAVDQEGGLVQRIRGAATLLPAFMSAGAARDPALTRRVYAAAAGELRGLGLTMDFAPDADVTIGAADPAIGSRSVGSDPAAVTRHVLAAARGFQDGGVVPVVKHFPGHGSVTADSHVTLPVQRRSVKDLERRDWVPFVRAVDAGLPAVMVGHLDVRAVDRGVPSSLSREVVTGLLRERLGFDGLVVTDALDMAAVRRHLGPDRAAVAALRAGADVALMPVDPAGARTAIVRAVRGGYLTRLRLEQAAARQVALLLHQRATARPRQVRPPGAGRPLAARLSARALTSVAGPCSGRIAPSFPIPFGDPTAVASFRLAAREAGLALGRVDYVKPPRPEIRKKWSKMRKQRVLRRWRAIDPRPVLRGTRIDLVGTGDPVPSSDHVVAVDTPYVLGRTSAAVRVATYGSGPAPMRALVAFWLGRAPAPGRLPVDVPGVRRGC